ncbi:MAG: PAS domain-containing protein [Dongiaceae bacterium]
MYIAWPRHLPSIKKLHDYWNLCRGNRVMPRRADIDPADIPQLLPYIYLVDIERLPFRVRYRVVGTNAVEWQGHDFTGYYLDELRFNKPDEILALYRSAADEMAPKFRSTTWPTPNGITRAVETAVFPLSEDGEHVTQCIAIEDFEEFRDPSYLL